MHVLIINGSPRVKKYSNTNYILVKFTEGLRENGASFEQYEISDRGSWDQIRQAFDRNTVILIALPLYVECIPGLLIEFLETLTPKSDGSKLAFLLQGGFMEGVQLRCGEAYLKILAGKLGCAYMGTLVKGDNFMIRFFEGEWREKVTDPYADMGREYAVNGDFNSKACKKFTGHEKFPLPVRIYVGHILKTQAAKGFEQIAAAFECDKPLDFKPY
ncbi:MAG: NAD(P)H-dependent oxidoreductase [Clostridia bacterium]|nr:NAD(P)H-dependent oxidoreductase [Clostridia bacterium]